jgi:hypothetical protein
MIEALLAVTIAGSIDRVVSQIPPPEFDHEPTKIELVCHSGKLYREMCFGPDGSWPCTLGPPSALSTVEMQAWKGCGGMSILGTFAILGGAHGADLVTTSFGLNEEDVKEANFLLGDPTKEPLKIVGAKIAAIAGATFLIHEVLERKWPALARKVRWATAGLLGGVSANNIVVGLIAREHKGGP